MGRLGPHLGVGGPDIAPRRAALFAPWAREGQSAAMKWVRINETWYMIGDVAAYIPAGCLTLRPTPAADSEKNGPAGGAGPS